VIKGLSVELAHEIIGKITTFPSGVPWRKEHQRGSQIAKMKFFLEGEEAMDEKMGSEEQAYHILGMKFSTTL